MGTAASVKEVSGKGEATGVIPRCIKSIFATIQSVRADYDVNMKVCPVAAEYPSTLLLLWWDFGCCTSSNCSIGWDMRHTTCTITEEQWSPSLTAGAQTVA